PFVGGWFLYLGYELAGQVEPTLVLPQAHDGLPAALAVRIPAAVIYDRLQDVSYFVAESGRPDLIEQMISDTDDCADPDESTIPCVADLTEENPDRYIEGVKRIKQYIVEGDVFQVNLSRSWQGELKSQDIAPSQIYQRLCERNPAPFACLALIGGAAIISSSPERLARVREGWLETRPIAGTRPRGEHEQADRDLREELLAHPKEQAEHIMLIDLERNDLGRVCQPGTVEVNELMVPESYTHVHHIVSNVKGKLRKDITPGDVIRAIFPGGTITGCPKVRCMEIIAEIEDEGRGAYTGSIGYLCHDGSMDLNILIRTIVQSNNVISLRAGAGIVADSIPEKELDETRAKARGMVMALS
ncbi:aminodeoxychorismate synthase component I, partial [Kaarinaea lacus]